jgi:hypothetical protein
MDIPKLVRDSITDLHVNCKGLEKKEMKEMETQEPGRLNPGLCRFYRVFFDHVSVQFLHFYSLFLALSQLKI